MVSIKKNGDYLPFGTDSHVWLNQCPVIIDCERDECIA